MSERKLGMNPILGMPYGLENQRKVFHRLKDELISLHKRQYHKKRQMKNIVNQLAKVHLRMVRNRVVSPEGHPGAVYVPLMAVESLINLLKTQSSIQKDLNEGAKRINEKQEVIRLAKLNSVRKAE